MDDAPEALEAQASGEPPTLDGEKRLIARDSKNVPLLSPFPWAGEAVERILRVPSGFMRNRTQDRIEALAAEQASSIITLALVEDGIAIGRQMMEEMLQNQVAAKAATVPHPEGNGTSASGESAHGTYANGTANGVEAAPLTIDERKPPINEVGSPSALQARRAGPHPELDGAA
jgi:hypothetical protein